MFESMSAGTAYQRPEIQTETLLHGMPAAQPKDYPLRVIITTPLNNPANRLGKRVFDLVFSSAVILLVLSWMFPVVALLVKLTSSGPVLFRQQRNGLNNHPFWCLKFRTMYVNADAHLKQATQHDPRITTVGRLLRKLSLDEMPQFFNVFTGSMSVVGPRPHMISHSEHYSQVIESYMIRHVVRPGITGLSQVQGYRGETKCPNSMRNRVRLDIFYLRKWSFMIDMRIMIKTIRLIILGDKNAY